MKAILKKMMMNNAVVNALGHITINNKILKKEVKNMSNEIDYIDQMINEIHVPHASKIQVEKELLEEKRVLNEVIPLLPKEAREERAKGILNYCKGLYKMYKQNKLHSGKEMYVRQANSRINEIIRRANNKIIKLDKGIIELKNCKDVKGLEQIDAKMPTIW